MTLDELVQLCFSRPHTWTLERSFDVMSGGHVLSHVEAGVREVLIDRTPAKMGLIAWVCTDPAWRGLQLASGLVFAAQTWSEQQGCDWSGLFADIPEFYRGLGYEDAPNLGEFGMVAQLGTKDWDQSAVIDLKGDVW